MRILQFRTPEEILVRVVAGARPVNNNNHDNKRKIMKDDNDDKGERANSCAPLNITIKKSVYLTNSSRWCRNTSWKLNDRCRDRGYNNFHSTTFGWFNRTIVILWIFCCTRIKITFCCCNSLKFNVNTALF